MGVHHLAHHLANHHIAHTAQSTHSFLKEKIWMLSIFLACTHRTHYPQYLARKNMDATYYFHLHALHTLHTLPTLVQSTHYERNICVYYFHLHTSSNISIRVKKKSQM